MLLFRREPLPGTALKRALQNTEEEFAAVQPEKQASSRRTGASVKNG
jgi:hypothetical protein